MARRRMIDPNFWQSEDISKLSIFARLIFIGMISNADDEGRGRANTNYLKSIIFPYDDIRIAEVDKALSEISHNTSVILYEQDGNKYYLFANWSKWQRVDKPQKSTIPPPDKTIPEPFRSNSGVIPESFLPKRKEEKLKEVKLKEKEKEKEKELPFDEYAKDDAELLRALYDFAEMRKAIKKPLATDKAVSLLLSKLDKLASDNKTKIAILEQSILNNWQGIFGLKGGTHGSVRNSNQAVEDKWGDLPGVRNF